MVRPAASSRRNSSQFAQSGTRFELAISTRGAHSWVRSTPTGRPGCTSSVSAPPRAGLHRRVLGRLGVGGVADDGVVTGPVPGRLPAAAVDDELPGMLGDLGV